MPSNQTKPDQYALKIENVQDIKNRYVEIGVNVNCQESMVHFFQAIS